MRNGKSKARGFVAIECAFVPLIASNALFVYTAVMNITHEHDAKPRQLEP